MADTFDDGMASVQRGNFVSAHKIWLALAESGNAWTTNNIGYMYKRGEGVKPDPVKAVYWWSKAANAGIPDAQNNVGVCFANGFGVVQSWDEAKKW